jgi:hypothetical protein
MVTPSPGPAAEESNEWPIVTSWPLVRRQGGGGFDHIVYEIAGLTLALDKNVRPALAALCALWRSASH